MSPPHPFFFYHIIYTPVYTYVGIPYLSRLPNLGLHRVAYTGISNATLDMACGDDGELGGYHVENCTASDIRLPVTLL